MTAEQILEFVDKELSEVVTGKDDYQDGYIAALHIVKRFIQDEANQGTTKTRPVPPKKVRDRRR